MASTLKQHQGLGRVRFFSNPNVRQPTILKGDSAAWVRVGTGANSGFRAVAAGLVELVLNDAALNPLPLQSILKRHLRYFPEHNNFTNVKGISSPREKLQIMARVFTLPELVPKLAFTLRQAAVDEMITQPAKYRDALKSANHLKSVSDLRQIDFKLGQGAIAAVAYALDIPIHLYVVQPSKELPSLVRYNFCSNLRPVKLRNVNDDYQVHVKQAKQFHLLASRKNTFEVDITKHHPNDPNLNLIVYPIQKSNKQIQKKYDTIANRLHAQVAAGELSENGLFKIYVKSITNQPQSKLEHIGTEFGTQALFEDLNPAIDSVIQPMTQSIIIQELIQAISRNVSLGQLSEDDCELNTISPSPGA